MKVFYKFSFVFFIALIPFVLQSQEDPNDNWGDEGYEDGYDDGCPIPCDPMFESMEEIFDDETYNGDGSNGGDISYNAIAVPINACPSSKSMKVKVKVSISAPTSTAAKDSLKAYVAKYENSAVMNNALKKKFKCADCDLPGIGKCPKSVTNVKITFSSPSGSNGKYTSTITVKFKANCGECPLLIIQPETNPSAIKLVSVYPNPGTNTINVTIELVDNKTLVYFKIYDVAGKIVKTIKAPPQALLLQQDIDIFDLENGMYFLESTQGDSFKEVTQFMKLD